MTVRSIAIAAVVAILLSAVAIGSAYADRSGGHRAGPAGTRSAQLIGSHFRSPHSVPRPAHFQRPFVHRPVRRLIVVTPLVAPLYFYPPPAFYAPPAYLYSPQPMYAYERPAADAAPPAPANPPVYESPPAYDYPPAAAPPTRRSPPAQNVEPQAAAPKPQTTIYYCAETKLFTDDIRDKECAEGWRKVTQ